MTVTKTIYNHFLVSIAMRISTYIIKITTENVPGTLGVLANVFERHALSIKKVQSHDSPAGHLPVISFWVNSTKKYLDQILTNLKAHGLTKYISVQHEEQLIGREVVLFKLDSEVVIGNRELAEIIEQNHLEFWRVKRDFTILSSVIEEGRNFGKIYKALMPYGILEYARSGKAYITNELDGRGKPMTIVTH